MEYTPSVTRKYLEDLCLMQGDLNRSLISALYDYRNEFILIGAVDLSDHENVTLSAFLRKREETGYHVLEFRIEEIFSPAELDKIDSVLIRDVQHINTLSVEINALGTDTADISLIRDKWRKIDSIISSRQYSYNPGNSLAA